MKRIAKNKTFEIKAGLDNDPITFGNEAVKDRVEADMKIAKFNGEDWVSFAYEDFNTKNPKMREGRKAIKFKRDENGNVLGEKEEPVDELVIENGKESVEFYELTNDKTEFQITLYERPEKNTFQFILTNHERFNFIYQPELQPDEIRDKCTRRDDMIGGYVVYHKTKRHHAIGKTNYRTGKIMDMPKPYAIDAKGNMFWADLSIIGNRMNITFKHKDLSDAIYPVVVDPTFGQTSKGASCDAEYNSIASKFTLPVLGSISDIRSANGRDSAAGTVASAIWDDDGSAGIPLTLVVSTTAATPAVSGGSCSSYGFTTYAVSPEVELAAGDWWIGSQNSATGLGWDMSYDAGTTGQGRTDSDNLPLGDWTGGSSVDRAYSVYATYTEVATAIPASAGYGIMGIL